MNLNVALNHLWIYGNILMTAPFLLSGINRFIYRHSQAPLWTDHITRVLLVFSWVFYCIDILVKYSSLGTDGICEKAFLIHHLGALLTIPPLVINEYIPWWVSPLGWMHGVFRIWPQHFWLNYIYVGFVFVFQAGMHLDPYKQFRYYRVSRFAVNYVHAFFLLVVMGKGCRNYFSTD